MKAKNVLLLIFLFAAAFIVGGLVAQFAAGNPFLKWLSYGMPLALNDGKPFAVDLILFKLWLGFSMKLNIAEIIFIIIALLLHRKLK